MKNTTQQLLDKLNKQLEGITPFKLALVDPKSIELAEKNARYMTPKMFGQLVDNIKRDKNLSSVPFCVLVDKKFKVLSGNHRVQAAVQAGTELILIMYAEGIEEGKKLSIQLSHNAIAGKDDAVILSELWNSLNDVDLKAYVGFDDEYIKKLEAIEFAAIQEGKIEYKQVIFLFLPEELEELQKSLKEIGDKYSSDPAFVAKLKDYEPFLNVVAKSKNLNNIINNTVALMHAIRELADIYRKKQEQHGTSETTSA